jgi:hypothetical protein
MSMKPDEINDALAAEVLWHVDAKAEEIGWDNAAPQLYAVLIHRPPAEIAMALAREAGAPADADGLQVALFELDQLPGWPLVLDRSPSTASAINMMAMCVEQMPAVLRTSMYDLDKLYGLVLVSEAWMVRSIEIDEAERQGVLAKARSHHLDEHPDRIEVRMTYCVSKAGTMSLLMHERDGIAEITTGERAARMQGAMPTVLRRLVEALT